MSHPPYLLAQVTGLPPIAEWGVALAICLMAIKYLMDNQKKRDDQEQLLLDRFINDQYETIEKLRAYLDDQGNSVRQIKTALGEVEQRVTRRQTEILVAVNEKVVKLLNTTEALHRRMDSSLMFYRKENEGEVSGMPDRRD